MQGLDSDREEGEIVEDELEDVSDCSISPSYPGKSESATERLRSVSLSSISDSDLEAGRCGRRSSHHVPLAKQCRKKRVKNDKCTCKLRRRRRSLSSESEEEKVDQRTLRLLKEAIHIDTSKETQHNSLRARLKGLIEPISAKEEDGSSEEKKADSADTTDDKELQELRLEALKSAMLKKHLERKKRKAEEEKKASEKLGNDLNKENSNGNVEKSVADGNAAKKMCLEEKQVVETSVSVEEDVDIMRAMLLASMSKKITEASKLVRKPLIKPVRNVLPKPIVRTVVNKLINVPRPIKRTIKNTYFHNKVINNIKPKPKPLKPPIPHVEPLIINVNTDSDSDMDIEDPSENDLTKTVTEFLKQQRAQVEAKKVEEKPPPLDKSAMKLLPFSQQIEYHRLKQQLLNAKKKPRKPSHSQDLNRKPLKSKFTFIKQNSVAKDKLKNNPGNLQRTLSDMQIQKDGRLQVKGKYQELVPILKKVNRVSFERKCHENEIKRLLQELEKTKQKFNSSHQNFKSLVEELIKKKESIDKGPTVVAVPTKPITSTPLKNYVENKSVDLNKLEDSAILPPKPKEPASCVNNVVSTQESPKDIQNIVDPNDLNDEIMCRNTTSLPKAPSLPKYISPLDKRQSDFLTTDPLMMLCPFDLLGVCKDKECTYKHCS